MTSSPDIVTSESQLISVSSGANITTAGTAAAALAGRASHAIPVIARVAILLTLNVFTLGGNGFTLMTIRLTPRLCTKTNMILASMLVADFVTGVFVPWYAPYVLVVYVFHSPCRYNVAHAVLWSILMFPGYVSIHHLILICVERYIAIVYPLRYETCLQSAD